MQQPHRRCRSPRIPADPVARGAGNWLGVGAMALAQSTAHLPCRRDGWRVQRANPQPAARRCDASTGGTRPASKNYRHRDRNRQFVRRRPYQTSQFGDWSGRACTGDASRRENVSINRREQYLLGRRRGRVEPGSHRVEVEPVPVNAVSGKRSWADVPGAPMVVAEGVARCERRAASPLIDVRMLGGDAALQHTCLRQLLIGLATYTAQDAMSQWMESAAGYSTDRSVSSCSRCQS